MATDPTVSTRLTSLTCTTWSSNTADIGFEIPDEFVVGYALDYNEFFRDLNVSSMLPGHMTVM